MTAAKCPRCDGLVIREFDSFWCIKHGSFGFERHAGDPAIGERTQRHGRGTVSRAEFLTRHRGRCRRGFDRCSTCREWRAMQVEQAS